jgi:chromosomal replication initiator protein
MSQIWQAVKRALAKKIPEHSFVMWIEPLAADQSGKEHVRLACPNLFFRRRVLEHFGRIIQSELNQAAGHPIRMELIVSQSSGDDPTCDPPQVPPQQLPLPNMVVQPRYGRLLRKDFTFDQFVVGKSNDFAYSAALSVAAHNDIQQHALFLLSKTGMGKSHLSQAIGNHIMHQNPSERVYYMTAEDFTNEMVTSYKTNTINRFKNKYHKNCDVLLLEDVHYLSGKERTQIELAHTLDSLFNENKKIIFSSCYRPAEIPKLNETLRSRLSSGLISNIDPPKFKTRIKILQHYAKCNKWSIPQEVISYLASELTLDVRQLKSGLVGVASKASLLGRKIDIGLAASVVKNMVQQSKNITIGSIKKLICKYYNVTPKDLVSRSRKQAIVRSRQVAIYLARRYTDQPLQVIGKSFNRYHATALHAIGKVEKGIREGGALQGHVEYLSQKIESGDY